MTPNYFYILYAHTWENIRDINLFSLDFTRDGGIIKSGIIEEKCF